MKLQTKRQLMRRYLKKYQKYKKINYKQNGKKYINIINQKKNGIQN